MSDADTWALIPHGVLAKGRKIHRQFALIPSPPQDQPHKRYLLAGPLLDMQYATFKKLEALNRLLELRVAERKIRAEGEEARRQTLWAMATKRLPM
jgi:hypothetical protein